MRSFLVTFVIATLASALLVPLARAFALRVGATSKPGGRNVNVVPTPRLGGVAIFLAFLLSLGAIAWLQSSVGHTIASEQRRFLALAVGATLMCLTGALDDLRGVRALHKLGVQILAASIVFAGGIRIEVVAVPYVNNLQMGIFAYPVTVLWIVGIVNAINLIDGLDGLAAGITIFAAATNFLVAWISGSTLVCVLMAALLGGTLGFLFYNFNPARIFMGDSGSYFIGFVLACSALLGSHQKTSTAVALLVPMLALGVPIFDTLFSIVRRFLERRPIFSPDRGHIHHRLVDMGLTHRRAVLLIYAVSVLFAAAALAVAFGSSAQIGVALFCAAIVLVGLVRFVGYFEYALLLRRRRERFRSEEAERLRHFVSGFVAALSEAHDAAHVLELAAGVAGTARVSVVEFRAGSDRVVTRAEGRDSDVVDTLRYPLSADDAEGTSMYVSLRTPLAELPADEEILLQLIADLTSRRLRELEPSSATVHAGVAGERSSQVATRTPVTGT